MKKLLFLTLLVTGLTQAQIVTIPDANFKAKLIALGVDTNTDGEIQNSEALAKTTLDLRASSISDLTGIEAFVNLTDLVCSQNNLTTVNVSPLTHLTSFECGNNQLASLDVTSLTNLTYFICDGNYLTSLNVTPLTQLTFLSCQANAITALDLSQMNLHILDCSSNQLTALNVSTCTNMTTLYCDNNPITSLNTTGLSLLEIFYFGSPVLTSITFGNHPHLRYLVIYGCQQETIDFSGVRSIQQFACDDCAITSLDFSAFPYLDDVRLRNDPNITDLNVKNGVNYTSVVEIINCPNLLYTCTDPIELDQANQQFVPENGNNPNGHASVYCTFTPGGIYNTITGTIRYDANNNGCDTNDAVQPYIKVKIADATLQTAYTFTNTEGKYTFYTPEGNYTLVPELENPSFFNISPTSATVSSPVANNTTATRDFCISANGVHPDVEVVITPLNVPRPGFEAYYKIVYRNKGNQTTSTTFGIQFLYNPNQMEIIDASSPYASLDSGQMVFDYDNLLPFESRSITVKMHIFSPVELIHPVNLGDILTLNASIDVTAPDETPEDNTFNLNQTAVNSLDPNLIECLEGANVAPSEIGKYLHYNIQFENTGTASAQNIVVVDTIDTEKYDINSLQILNASHPVYARINGNVVEFVFENIDLPVARTITDPITIGGHGNVLFKMKSINTLQANDQVTNAARIYFDYNAPIITNDAVTTFALLTSGHFEKDDSIRVYPNPAKNNITISADHNIESIQLYDVQGRLLETASNSMMTATFDISKRANGIYFVKATSEKGSSVEKIIKE